jgi:phage tail sheath protein FI
MPEYLTPGVHIKEISAGPKPIEGVGTSTAGMLGLTERGPVGVRLVTNLGEFRRYYGGYLKESYLPAAVEGFFGNGGTRCFIARIISASADSAQADLGGIFLRAVGPGTWGNNVGLMIMNSNADSSTDPLLPNAGSKTFNMVIAYWKNPMPDFTVIPALTAGATPGEIKSWKKAVGDLLDKADVVESFDDLSITASSPNFFGKVIDSRSFLIKVTKTSDPDDEDKPDSDLTERPDNTATFLFLTGGAQPGSLASLDDFKGDPAADAGKKRGLEAFREVDAINIVYCPDIHWSGIADKQALQNAVKDHCESMKDRFAILDSSQGESVIPRIQNPVDSSFAAFYYPWIKVYDPLLKDRRLVPPGGFVAGIYARTDIERGVHKAPANEIVKGALELEFLISKGQQDILNPKGINVIRQFPGRGIRIWGARTASSDPEWRYVNVRRLFLYVEESIKKGTQWVVFEPNNE